MLLAGTVWASEPAYIQVNGQARVAARPDMARVDLGVISEAQTARAALDQNNAAMRRLADTLKRQGIAERDIQTRHFDVTPVYDYGEDRQRERLRGYRVSNQVQVRVRELARLGPVLDAVIEVGANRVAGIGFDVQEPRALLERGRREAIEDARHRAQLYAEASGVRLGRLLRVEETAAAPPAPVRMMAEQAVPIAEGEVELGVSLNVRYEIAQ